jgi:hypothetical protein
MKFPREYIVTGLGDDGEPQVFLGRIDDFRLYPSPVSRIYEIADDPQPIPCPLPFEINASEYLDSFKQEVADWPELIPPDESAERLLAAIQQAGFEHMPHDFLKELPPGHRCFTVELRGVQNLLNFNDLEQQVWRFTRTLYRAVLLFDLQYPTCYDRPGISQPSITFNVSEPGGRLYMQVCIGERA